MPHCRRLHATAGTLPEYLGTMDDLRYVWLNDNYFTGER